MNIIQERSGATIESELARRLVKSWPRRTWSIMVKPAVGGQVKNVTLLLVTRCAVHNMAAACVPSSFEPVKAANFLWKRLSDGLGAMLRNYPI